MTKKIFALNHKGSVTMETERFILRKFVKSDAEFMYKNWATDEATTRFLTWKPHQSLKVTQDVMDSWCDHYSQKTYQWAIVLKEINEPIGSIGLCRMNEEESFADFGYCIGSKYWGQGIVTSAMNLLLDFWFNEVGFERIDGYHDINNPASGRVMQKVGMTFVENIKGEYKNNSGNDAVMAKYQLLKDDFTALRTCNALHVRKAFKHEENEVGKLYGELCDYLNNGTNYCGWSKEYYPTAEVAFEATKSDCLFVAVKNGEIAGSVILNSNQSEEYMAVNWKDKTDNPLVIHTLAINPKFIRQGVAEKLLSFADDYARKNNISSIRLDTSEKNVPAIALYEKCGYEKRGSVDLGLYRDGVKEWFVFEKIL